MRLYGIARPLILCDCRKGRSEGDVVTALARLRSWVELKSDSSMTLHPAPRDSLHSPLAVYPPPNKRQLRGHIGVTAVNWPAPSHFQSLQNFIFRRRIWLNWKEKDLKAKSGNRLDSLQAYLSPFSLSPPPTAPLDFTSSLSHLSLSASHLASPLRTGSASYLRARPAAMLALVAARQRTQAAEAAVQYSAERRGSAALCCACTAHFSAQLYLSPSPAAPAQAGAVRCTDSAWGVEVDEEGGRAGGE